MLYRVLKPGETRPAKIVRIRVPVKKWADFDRPNAGYRCLNKACSVSVVLIEVDSTTLPHPRAAPHVRSSLSVLWEAATARELLRDRGAGAGRGALTDAVEER